MVETHPENARAWYLMAYSEWTLRQREKSMAHLQRAMDLDPDNQNYRKEWKAIHHPKANSESFRGNFNIQIASEDIY